MVFEFLEIDSNNMFSKKKKEKRVFQKREFSYLFFSKQVIITWLSQNKLTFHPFTLKFLNLLLKSLIHISDSIAGVVAGSYHY